MQHENSENTEKGKDRLIRLFSNRRYVVAGIIAVICIGGLIIIGVLSSEGEKIESFAQRWKSAVESKDVGKYRELWDTVTLSDSKEAKQQYEEAVKRTRSYDKIVAQVKTLVQRKDPRNPDLYQIESIPVELFKEKQLLMRTYRDLVVKRKGPRKRWYLVRDQEQRDQQEFPQSSQEMMVGTEAEGTTTTTEESSLTGSGKTSGTEQTAIIGEAPSGISSSTPVDTQLKIKQVLGAWQGSWQNEDIQTYMAQYAEEARITRVTVIDGKEVRRKILNKARLRQGMERLLHRLQATVPSIATSVLNPWSWLLMSRMVVGRSTKSRGKTTKMYLSFLSCDRTGCHGQVQYQMAAVNPTWFLALTFSSTTFCLFPLAFTTYCPARPSTMG